MRVTLDSGKRSTLAYRQRRCFRGSKHHHQLIKRGEGGVTATAAAEWLPLRARARVVSSQCWQLQRREAVDLNGRLGRAWDCRDWRCVEQFATEEAANCAAVIEQFYCVERPAATLAAAYLPSDLQHRSRAGSNGGSSSRVIANGSSIYGIHLWHSAERQQQVLVLAARMASGGGSTPVILRVYDISRGMASRFGSMLLGRPIEGVWHSGIQINELEYFYGGGIIAMVPWEIEANFQMKPSKIETLGTTTKTLEEIRRFVNEVSPRFTADTYDLLHNNCNHFTQEFCQFLLGKSLPQYITNQVQEIAETPLRNQQTRTDRQLREERLQAAATPSPFGEVLRNVCTSQTIVSSSKRVFLLAIKTLINNINKPKSELQQKHLRLDLSNEILRSKVLRIQGGREALALIGFKPAPATADDGEQEHATTENFLYFSLYDVESEERVHQQLQQQLPQQLRVPAAASRDLLCV
ncbi:uba ts-n domain-containing protein [Cyclospora cayetanensis]|uniref:Uba ts-n domain-containing protein n=1 Tax=Cyclospora cayetanensis TaxID=88456 RepID=A0A1D3CX44_9EIME|nr:uba ts-n domain-containing protein [Cyclospora cayetanensis]